MKELQKCLIIHSLTYDSLSQGQCAQRDASTRQNLGATIRAKSALAWLSWSNPLRKALTCNSLRLKIYTRNQILSGTTAPCSSQGRLYMRRLVDFASFCPFRHLPPLASALGSQFRKVLVRVLMSKSQCGVRPCSTSTSNDIYPESA